MVVAGKEGEGIMHITKYLNEIEEKEYDNNITVKRLVEIVRSQKTLCDNYYFNPTWRHAETIINEICNLEVDV